jgi:hypothetical protein
MSDASVGILLADTWFAFATTLETRWASARQIADASVHDPR